MIQSVNIVILGSLNPAIFQPSWLASNKLIKYSEAENVQLEIVHPQIAKFSTEWFLLNVSAGRFQVATTQEPYYEPLRDLVIGIFSLLRHTPVTALGINQEFHYSIESEKKWHKIGDSLAPKTPWESVLSTPRMLNIIMKGERSDDYKGYILAKIEPSPRETFGIFISVNDHYELPSDNSGNVDGAINILKEQWTESMQRGVKVAHKIAKLGEDK